HPAVDAAGDYKSVRCTLETYAGRLRTDRHMLNDRAVSLAHGQTLDRKPVIEKDVLAGGIEIYAIHVGELVFRLEDDRRGTHEARRRIDIVERTRRAVDAGPAIVSGVQQVVRDRVDGNPERGARRSHERDRGTGCGSDGGHAVHAVIHVQVQRAV